MGKAEEDGEDQARGGASVAELEILTSELDKANLRLADVEARNEQLRLDLAQSTARAGESTKPVSVEDDPAFLRLRSENSSLLRKLDASRYEKDSEKSKQRDNNRIFEREIAALKEDREILKKKMEKMADYDEVKQELDMLKVAFMSPQSMYTLTNSTSPSNLRPATQKTPMLKLTLKSTAQQGAAKQNLWKSFCSLATKRSMTS